MRSIDADANVMIQRSDNEHEKHECVIGIYSDYDSLMPVSLNQLKGILIASDDLKKVIQVDPVYMAIYHSYRHYTLSDYLDRRKNTNLSRFEYCPVCGKEIDWKKLRRVEIASSG